MTRRPLHASSAEWEVPPAVFCGICGKSECAGCPSEQPDGPTLASRCANPWERPPRPGEPFAWMPRLIETAEATTIDCEQFFGQLLPGRILPALSFALLSETWAVSSFCAIWIVLGGAFFPTTFLHLLQFAALRLLAALIFVALIVLVILIHIVWGIALEWGIHRAGQPAKLSRGLRLGLYACGWDFMASPAGLAWSMARKGPRAGARSAWRATAAPRRGIHQFLAKAVGLSPAQEKTATQVTVVVTVLVVLALALGLLVSLISWLLTLGV